MDVYLGAFGNVYARRGLSTLLRRDALHQARAGQGGIRTFSLLLAICFEQVLVHQSLRERLVMIANGLVDPVMNIGDRAKGSLAIGRAATTLVEEGRHHFHERGEDLIA